ncbi:hypothetical protein DFH08DRAFT_903625 [Mycena albidolilacea]|uniref:Hydrophobin n=1 Tax=Mycena albidolilacea TaxID=1033008 RepID=A0AAD6Z265_9AGAR|nr:hypothetical protein DFH08DRAFT_903625 [Mycena albidolilacea]
MFPKLSLAVTAVLATLAVASLTNPSPPTTIHAEAAGVLALLGVVLDAVVPVGLSYSPITVSGNNWGSTQVTCNSPQGQTGLAVIGCVPITA